ncbi:MAG: hypothetical protein HZC54_00725 [Verrucomicrobia bacterium]|nr:hypothetical protein [Verrucomicrobiota bacterium]
MIFESYSKRFALVMDNGKRANFLPGPDYVINGIGDKIYFGRLDTASKAVQKAAGLGEEELNAVIMASGSFKHGVPSAAGVWKREARVAAESKVNKRAAFEAMLGELKDEELIQMIAFLKLDVPMGAPREQLVKIYADAKFGPAETPAPAALAGMPAATAVAPADPAQPKAVRVRKPKAAARE